MYLPVYFVLISTYFYLFLSINVYKPLYETFVSPYRYWVIPMYMLPAILGFPLLYAIVALSFYSNSMRKYEGFGFFLAVFATFIVVEQILSLIHVTGVLLSLSNYPILRHLPISFLWNITESCNNFIKPSILPIGAHLIYYLKVNNKEGISVLLYILALTLGISNFICDVVWNGLSWHLPQP